MSETNVNGWTMIEANEEARDQECEAIIKEYREEINRRFALRWDENHCCPHFVIVDCVAGSPHKHVGCQFCIDRGEGPGIDNAHAALVCLGSHRDDCPLRFANVE